MARLAKYWPSATARKLNTSKVKLAKASSIYCLVFSLAACQLMPEQRAGETPATTEKQFKRASLADLAKSLQQTNEDRRAEFVSARALQTKQERSNKLAEIYQSMVLLEPDANVRAQINYRLLELDTEYFQEVGLTELDDKQSRLLLAKLVDDHQTLLARYPNRAENENLYYQLAKAYDLQGELLKSLATIEQIIALYPQTLHLAELLFRQAEIYYSQQDYRNALAAYQQVLTVKDNEKYRLNSLYMSGWSLFKANELALADEKFMAVLAELMQEQQAISASQQRFVSKFQAPNVSENENQHDFDKLTKSKQSLVTDTLRILTISLSQQQQVQSLLALLDRFQLLDKDKQYITALEHVLFQQLASFLIEKKLEHDAELTYQAYIKRKPNSIWSTRFNLALIAMATKRGAHPEVRTLQQNYVEHYGLKSNFWQQANIEQQQEVLPSLLAFSQQRSRRLYAYAQDVTSPEQQVIAFGDAANWLGQYLSVINFTNSEYPQLLAAERIDVIAELSLFADASFQAQNYQQALISYQNLAYGTDKNKLTITTREKLSKELSERHDEIKQVAAYASTLTVRKLLSVAPANQQTTLLQKRAELDKAFIVHYPNDARAKVLASQAGQYSFASADYDSVYFYSDFILKHYGIATASREQIHAKISALDTTAFKQVQIASQLKADSFYQQHQYAMAEKSYLLALNFVDKTQGKRKVKEFNELIANSIYQQGLAIKKSQPEAAIAHWLRLGKVTPQASYRVNAEFDAANLLLQNKQWQQAISVLLAFQQSFPKHQYSASIPAKLADSYQHLAQYESAAEQLIIMQKSADSSELKRELQYSIAENYLKADNLKQAIIHFRTYAHSYPKPFSIAQEVRYKMSEFYRQTQEPNKRYFWYRKILLAHKTDVLQQADAGIELAVQQRSNYLASLSAYELGQAHQQSFSRTKLTLPLNKSLKRKQKSLKQAVSYYQQVFGFGLADFVPKANYQLAKMYQLLAADVMASQLPKGLDELAAEEYNILLEELAYPFEEKAIELFSNNTERAWQGLYDQWIKKSFAALAILEPAKFDKSEKQPEVIYALF